jgi:hypothetical protein
MRMPATCRSPYPLLRVNKVREHVTLLASIVRRRAIFQTYRLAAATGAPERIGLFMGRTGVKWDPT